MKPNSEPSMLAALLGVIWLSLVLNPWVVIFAMVVTAAVFRFGKRH